MHLLGTRFRLVIASVVALLTALVVGAAPAAAVPGSTSTVFINEIHYDNTGADAGEFVEIAGPAGTDLTGWSVVFYNGSSTQLVVYDTENLSGTLTDAGEGYGFVSVSPSSIQNGAPDGIALVDDAGTVVQFLSYEGVFTPLDGPAIGQESTDIGVSEGSSTPVGFSLQLTGSGTTAGDFSWTGPLAESVDDANAGQSFGGPTGPATPMLNEFSVDTAGTDMEYLEVFGSANTDYSVYSILEIKGVVDGGGEDPGLVVDEFAVGTTDANGLHLNSLASNTVENDPITLLLVENFTGAVGDDLDPDDDGTFDTTPWTSIADSVSISFNSSVNYSATVLDEFFDDATYTGGSQFFAPGGASRVPDGTGNWVRNDFDLADILPGSPEDGEALNTPGALNALVDLPADPVKIHEVQGSGSVVAIAGEVTVTAIVTSLFEDNDVRDGFFIQEEDADVDADPATSEGIFVFCRGGCPGVAVGDQVTVNGLAEEFFDMSQVDTTGGGTITIDSSGNTLPTASTVSLPASGSTTDAATFEQVEGMVVNFPDKLVISEYFQLARFGQLVLTVDERPEQFTNASAPSVSGFAAFTADLATRRIIFDDNNNDQNDATTSPLDNEAYPHPQGGLSLSNFFRGGDSITDLTGVLHWSFAGSGGTDAWRIRKIDGVDYTFTDENPRTTSPDAVGGSLTVASFNVLNFFNTLDEPGATCGPSALGCRGAHSASELQRQRDKIVSALIEIDADVVGLIEIENDAGASVADLVSALNTVAGAGTYDYVDTGTIGTDAIKVAFIYQPANVSAFGAFAILDSSVDPTFIDTKNRPVLIQTFEEVGGGGRFTAAINHFKSKGSACDDVGDPDANDGQGNCNGTRTAAANALAAYLATDPTGSGDPDFLILGDLNSYAMEDPITALEGTGYTDLVEQFGGPDVYSFVFNGQLGYLDHALANGDLQPQVTGTTVWNINADEVNVFDYNDDIQDANEASFERESNALPIYEVSPYRSSDHDPVIIGLTLDAPITYVSSTSGGRVGGVRFADEDILAFDQATGSWSLHFDGSDVGLGSRDVDAFTILDDQSLLLSFDRRAQVPGVGQVDDSDIVRFVPSQLGDTTAGVFELYFDGSDVGLRTSGEDVDALTVLADGRIVLSTSGSARVERADGSTLRSRDEDLLVFTSTALGTTTAGSFEIYLDGSDVGLTTGSEDVGGVSTGADSELHLTTRGNFTVTGLSGGRDDIFTCLDPTTGENSACGGFELFFDGSLAGIGSENIDAIHVGS